MMWNKVKVQREVKACGDALGGHAISLEAGSGKRGPGHLMKAAEKRNEA